MVDFNKTLQELSKKKGAYKLFVKKEMKTKHLNKKKVIADPTLIDPMVIKKGIFRRETIDLKVIEKEMRDTFKQMAEFSTNLVPGKQEKFFLGVGIVVLQT